MERRPRRHNRAAGLAGRIDRAAGAINPFLIVIAIGLFLLNLISFALLAANRPLARRSFGSTAAVAGPRPNPAAGLDGLQ